VVTIVYFGLGTLAIRQVKGRGKRADLTCYNRP
jgi:hypothetical protein